MNKPNNCICEPQQIQVQEDIEIAEGVNRKTTMHFIHTEACIRNRYNELRNEERLRNEVDHKIKSHDGDYAKFCDCGRDSFVCQECGRVKCSIYYGTKNGRNTCVQCGGKTNE